MENIRKYYSDIKRLLSRKKLSNIVVNIESAELANEALDGIKNKLLSMQKDVIPQYAKFIVDAINNEVSMFEYALETKLNYGYLLSVDLDYLYQHDYDEKFPAYVAEVFKEFGIRIEQDFQGETEYYRFCGLKLENHQSDNLTEVKAAISSRREPTASFAQQWVIVRNLMECAVGWRLTNDDNKLMYHKKDIAKFLSFLCGGSADRIRKFLECELPAKEANEIIPYLENIGLHKIAERIKKD